MTNLEAIAQLNLILGMERSDLEAIPAYPLPAGYTLHWYKPGDGTHWVAIQRATEKHLTISAELFVNEYGDDAQLLHKRLFFLRNPAGEFIATTAAWFTNNDSASRQGLIHWVAIKPEYQRRGLSNSLMSIACERMRELGHDSARLTTSSARIAAINLYLKFGFRPASFARTGEDIWQELTKHLKVP